MRPWVETFFDPATSTATHLVRDPASDQAALIDPVLDFDAGRVSTVSADAILARIAALGLKLAYVLETHVHADHLTAADYLRCRTGAAVAIGARIIEVQQAFGAAPDAAAFDRLLAEGDRLPLGGLRIEVLHTPGHTPADVTYRIGDAAFVGDTLFMPDFGTARADFPGGDPRTLYRSIRKVLALPPQTRLFVGHDYPPPGRPEPRWETTVGETRAANIHVHDGVEEDSFVAMRETRDATLKPPALMRQALEVNIRGGRLPPASQALALQACGWAAE